MKIVHGLRIFLKIPKQMNVKFLDLEVLSLDRGKACAFPPKVFKFEVKFSSPNLIQRIIQINPETICFLMGSSHEFYSINCFPF